MSEQDERLRSALGAYQHAIGMMDAAQAEVVRWRAVQTERARGRTEYAPCDPTIEAALQVAEQRALSAAEAERRAGRAFLAVWGATNG